VFGYKYGFTKSTHAGSLSRIHSILLLRVLFSFLNIKSLYSLLYPINLEAATPLLTSVAYISAGTIHLAPKA
jgi:hypothetical protein